MTRRSRVNGVLGEAGFLDAADGTVLLSGPAALLLDAWRRWAHLLFAPFADSVLDAPLFIAGRILDASGYRAGFPQNVVTARGAGPHPRISFATPAACLHLYPTLRRTRLPRRGRALVVEARCARYERGRWRFPYRLQSFRMIELVLAGSRELVEERCTEATRALSRGLARLGLEGEWRPANDPFFADGARLLQRMSDAKREFTVRASPPVALASVNRHGDHFGRAFHIREAAGVPAFSACVALGLERLTAHALLVWGGRRDRWPRGLRS